MVLVVKTLGTCTLARHLLASAQDIRDAGSVPGLGRSPGKGHGNPLQYSCVENPMDRGAWWAIVHWVTNSRTQLKRLSMQPSLWSISHICTWILEKTITLTRQIVVSKVMSLLFHMLSSFIIAFLPRSKCLLILWPTVTIHSDFGAQENKICHSVHLFPICALKWWDQMPWS